MQMEMRCDVRKLPGCTVQTRVVLGLLEARNVPMGSLWRGGAIPSGCQGTGRANPCPPSCRGRDGDVAAERRRWGRSDTIMVMNAAR